MNEPLSPYLWALLGLLLSAWLGSTWLYESFRFRNSGLHIGDWSDAQRRVAGRLLLTLCVGFCAATLRVLWALLTAVLG